MKSISEMATPLLENDQVRVVEVRMQPGERLPMHSHPNHLIYSLTSARVQFTLPDGRTEILDYVPERLLWREAEDHEVENVGDTESRVVIIELK